MIFTIFYNYENYDAILTAKLAFYAENSNFLMTIIENYSFLSFKNIFKNGTKKRGALMQIILIFFFSFSIVLVMPKPLNLGLFVLTLRIVILSKGVTAVETSQKPSLYLPYTTEI